MEENASTGSGNSNSVFVMKAREEEHRLNGMVRKEKSKKRKNKDIEEKKSITDNVARLLYNDTPSDGYDEEQSPSPKRMMKPPPFSKVWSDEDEISILRGIIKFKDQTGRDAGQNMAEFRAFILQSLTLQATLVQLREKIRRLREKYEKTVGRGNASLTTQHELQLFQLCQKIWTEHPNSSGTGHQNLLVKEKQNVPENGQPEQQNLLVKEKLNNPEKQHDIPEFGRPEQQNLLVKDKQNIQENGPPKQQNLLVKEKQNNPEKQHNIPVIGRPRQQNIPQIQQHKIIPETGLDAQTLEDLFKRISKDIELVTNSKACLSGNENEVGIRVLGLSLESMKLGIKLGTLVQEKANSPELRDSPELREQVVLRAYLEAKIEHAQLLLNAYNSFIKDHSNEAESSVSAIKD
ncbi:GLABROUS1 enhancer-binding protein-like 1 isoform X1 [Solanum dulcamara]|uniref:GLABROUS1 enhancer-binding protein-like 1 isoform X1 n=1 Tax=Solanum dulcamara TaxID=45834 RepID=UPI002485CD7E|nr:GLABROUS1 enhancer-binding protein-like 1 isoform X1 [Solanum dulcamara]